MLHLLKALIAFATRLEAIKLALAIQCWTARTARLRQIVIITAQYLDVGR